MRRPVFRLSTPIIFFHRLPIRLFNEQIRRWVKVKMIEHSGSGWTGYFVEAQTSEQLSVARNVKRRTRRCEKCTCGLRRSRNPGATGVPWYTAIMSRCIFSRDLYPGSNYMSSLAPETYGFIAKYSPSAISTVARFGFAKKYNFSFGFTL